LSLLINLGISSAIIKTHEKPLENFKSESPTLANYIGGRFPVGLRARIQDILTSLWADKHGPIQPAAPASLVVKTLQRVLGAKLRSYTFVDFCAGAGGPTPFVELEINKPWALKGASESNGQSPQHIISNDAERANSSSAASSSRPSPLPSSSSDASHQGAVDFVLTDLHPHVSKWRTVSQASPSGHLHYVPESVDATTATARQVFESTQPPLRLITEITERERRVFRLFHLAFHHFDDELAVQVLRNTLETSDGFAIFELQGRDLGSLFMTLIFGLILALGSWWWDWGNWTDLFLSGIIPVVPAVVVIDGLVSCLRTRTEEEINHLLRRAAADVNGGLDSWTFEAGKEVHSSPFGKLSYFIGTKE
jgi:hypothetical protein